MVVNLTGAGSNSQAIKAGPLPPRSLSENLQCLWTFLTVAAGLNGIKTPSCMNYSNAFFAERLETDANLCACVKLQLHINCSSSTDPIPPPPKHCRKAKRTHNTQHCNSTRRLFTDLTLKF